MPTLFFCPIFPFLNALFNVKKKSACAVACAVACALLTLLEIDIKEIRDFERRKTLKKCFFGRLFALDLYRFEHLFESNIVDY